MKNLTFAIPKCDFQIIKKMYNMLNYRFLTQYVNIKKQTISGNNFAQWVKAVLLCFIDVFFIKFQVHLQYKR